MYALIFRLQFNQSETTVLLLSYDRAEILLKVALNTKKSIIYPIMKLLGYLLLQDKLRICISCIDGYYDAVFESKIN